MKRTGFAIKGVTLKDGKIIAGKRRMSVSERIRQKASKRVRVVKKGAT